MAKVSAQIASLSFEEALKQLEEIVRRIEAGEVPLEQAIEDYTRGTELSRHCQRKLEDARLKVEKLSVRPDGSLTVEPLEDA